MAVFSLRKPAERRVREFMESQAEYEYSYHPYVGATRNDECPAGYVVDRTRIQLGSGEGTYQIAKTALLDWQHYGCDWLSLYRPAEMCAVGHDVAVVARAVGVWSTNVCRVVYVIDEEEPIRRSAFAYGTLPGHVEMGEERFQIEWHPDDSVWFEILAFSRPNHLLVYLAYPYIRSIQKQFGRDATRALQAAVTHGIEQGSGPVAN
ncbi:MAG: DUF1990 domain-containing protein [Planctomycetaceae bacterium]